MKLTLLSSTDFDTNENKSTQMCTQDNPVKTLVPQLYRPQIAILKSGWFQKYSILTPGQCQKNATVQILKVSHRWKWNKYT